MVDDLVVLVSPSGEPIGEQFKSLVHNQETPLHLAFSTYLFDPAGRLLMTRRALTKKTWPGVWTNSCCGHPRLDEPMSVAIRRRLQSELGLDVDDLRCVLPDFAYAAMDAGGVWENEICPVFAGSLPAGAVPQPDPDEVAEWAWIEWRDLVAAVHAAPFAFSPWAVKQITALGVDSPHSG